jgi:hypothetical protein
MAGNPKPMVAAKQEKIEIRDYVPEPTARMFHADHNDVRGIMGPVGSGKTVACCMEAWSRISEQPPGRDNVRRSRWAFIRNTYGELLSTTMKTWQEWIPDQLCHITMSAPITGRMNFWLPDRTRVQAEIIFLAVDRPEDTRKLKSLELTGVFLNEASELHEEVKTVAFSRTGRYPAKIDGGGKCWSGMIMDTNPPPDDHWWHELAEVKKPLNHTFYRQPPAVLPVYSKNPNEPPSYVPNEGQVKGIPPAENVRWQGLGYEYWLRQTHGADPEWVKVYCMGEYGSIVRGKPVYPEYSDAAHYSREPLDVYRGLPLIIGWDFGLTPACAFLQATPKGTVQVIDECVSTDMELRRFVEEIVNPKIRTEYYGIPIISVGDPAGDARSQTDGRTCMNILAECGIPTVPASTNNPIARRDAVKYYLTRMVDGGPAFKLGPKCPTLRKAFQGEYQFKEMRIGGVYGRKRYHEIAEKNFFSHISDALQYGFLQIREGLKASDPGSLRNDTYREVKGVDLGAWI